MHCHLVLPVTSHDRITIGEDLIIRIATAYAIILALQGESRR